MIRVIFLGLGLVISEAWAQSDLARAENDWRNVQASSQATVGPKVVHSPHAQIEQALAARQAADVARRYYLTHPSSTRASEARKQEVIFGLKGLLPGDADYEQRVRKIADAFRLDQHIPAGDRFEVAILAESTALLDKSSTANSRHEARKAIADKLLAEFHDLPDAFYYYAAVARSADSDTAVRMAANLVHQSAAPVEARADAQEILDRQDMIGKPVDLRLLDDEDKPVTLSSSKPTIVYFWAPTTTPTFADLKASKSVLRSDVQVIYCANHVTAEQIKAAKEKAPMAGAFCHPPESGELGKSAMLLKPRRLPWVLVVNRSGELKGFGPPDQLKTLLEGSGR